MKKIISIISLAIMVVAAGSFEVNAQSKRECSVYTIAKPVVKSRGKNKIISINSIAYLPKKIAKSRGKAPACMFSMFNYHNQAVHVYADDTYIGSIRANSVGVVETLNSYSKIYCITEDQSYSWEEPGNCSCIHVYHLRIKENEGQIIE